MRLHQRFNTNPYDFHRWVFDHILDVLALDGEILEVGCGSGELWRKSLDRYQDSLVITEAAPLIAYIRSMPAESVPPLEGLARLTKDLEDRIATDGAICIAKESGLFVATR